MLAAALETCGQTQQFGFLDAGRGLDRHDARLALGERAGLVDHQRVDLLQALQRLGALDQHARLRAAPDADHDRHRRGETQRAGAGDDEDGDGRDQAIGEARLRSPDRPRRECQERRTDHGRHEPARDLVRQPLNGRAAALGLRHHLHDLREHRVAADLVGAHDEAARLVHGAADDPVADALGHGHGFSRHHGLVDRTSPFEDLAVDRHALAGPHAQAVADNDLIEAHILVRAVGPDAAGHLRGEIEQRANGAAGLLAGLQLQNLPEQHKHGDDGRRLEIDGNGAVMAAHRRREHTRQQGSDDAVDPRHAGAHGDQREHVEIAGLERGPGALEERPAGPQHDRCRQHELNPVRCLLAEPLMQIRQVPAHLQHEHRQGERQADPEPPGHVGEFGIGCRVRRHHLRLQRHAANGA